MSELPMLAPARDSRVREDDFDALVERTAPRLYRLAARLVGDAAEAEDVLQESYARAFDAMRAGRFDARSEWMTWLYRIVTNTALDALRSRDRGRRATPVLTDHDGGRDASRLHALAQLREISEWLSELPPEQRTALVLKELEGLSAAQVADVLGISEGAVEQRLVRARQTLRARSER